MEQRKKNSANERNAHAVGKSTEIVRPCVPKSPRIKQRDSRYTNNSTTLKYKEACENKKIRCKTWAQFRNTQHSTNSLECCDPGKKTQSRFNPLRYILAFVAFVSLQRRRHPSKQHMYLLASSQSAWHEHSS